VIYGIGIDMVAIHRMQENINKYGARFANKVLCNNELAEYAKTSRKASYLAKHFAAKEALAKAIGTGFRNGVKLSDICVNHLSSGQPQIQCAGKITDILSIKGITSCLLTLSDENEYAIACVVLET